MESLIRAGLLAGPQRFYVIGSSREKRWFRVLKIDRSEPSELNVSEDPVWYSLQEVKSLLQRIDEGNRATGGLTFVTKAYGIAGRTLVPAFFPFLSDQLVAFILHSPTSVALYRRIGFLTLVRSQLLL